MRSLDWPTSAYPPPVADGGPDDRLTFFFRPKVSSRLPGNPRAHRNICQSRRIAEAETIFHSAPKGWLVRRLPERKRGFAFAGTTIAVRWMDMDGWMDGWMFVYFLSTLRRHLRRTGNRVQLVLGQTCEISRLAKENKPSSSTTVSTNQPVPTSGARAILRGNDGIVATDLARVSRPFAEGKRDPIRKPIETTCLFRFWDFLGRVGSLIWPILLENELMKFSRSRRIRTWNILFRKIKKGRSNKRRSTGHACQDGQDVHSFQQMGFTMRKMALQLAIVFGHSNCHGPGNTRPHKDKHLPLNVFLAAPELGSLRARDFVSADERAFRNRPMLYGVGHANDQLSNKGSTA